MITTEDAPGLAPAAVAGLLKPPRRPLTLDQIERDRRRVAAAVLAEAERLDKRAARGLAIAERCRVEAARLRWWLRREGERRRKA